MGESKVTIKESADTCGAVHSKNRFVDAVLGVFIVTLALALCFLRIEPSEGRGFFYTTEYERLSLHPYSPSLLQSRSFLPLIAYLLGMGGARYELFSYVIILALLFATFSLLLKKTGDRIVAALGTLLISTLPLIEFGVYAPGWPDQFCFLMFLLSLLFPSGKLVFGVFGIFAHEFYVALLPSLFLMSEGPLTKKAFHCFLPFFVVLAIKYFFGFPPEGGVGPFALINDFLTAPFATLSSQPILFGLMSAFEVFILLMPCALFFCSREKIPKLAEIVLPTLIAGLCLFLAHDTTRVWSLAFPSFLLSVCALFQRHMLLIAATGVSLLLPSYSWGARWTVMLERKYSMVELTWRALFGN
jgi:hypothetical protein